MTWVAGVDGCRGGWIAVFRHVERGDLVWGLYERFADVLDAPQRPKIVALDLPIGLLDAAAPGGRGPEPMLRRLLAPAGRASCVFTPPVRRALAASTYAEALRINRRSSPHRSGISRQSFGLFAKLRELDALITPRLQARVREAHPEFAFLCMNRGKPVAEPKKTATGFARRAALLRRHGFGPMVAAARSVPRKFASPDDVLDAAAVCWTALRLLRGEATVLPERPVRDGRGLRMEVCG
jgi:predicted RNase H-like nuclease